MTKSEWASWAQFIGVVGSLLIALYFPLRSEAQRREQEKKDYLNERHALRKFKDDVIHFVGPLTIYSRAGNDLVIDEVSYGQILERISYFDRRLNDPSSIILLALMRNVLRAVDSYRHGAGDRDSNNANILRTFRDVSNANYKPEDERYLFGRGEQFGYLFGRGDQSGSGEMDNTQSSTRLQGWLKKVCAAFSGSK